MKPPTMAPAYACLYPGLCAIARELGYCLAIHGSVSRDLDLIAIPWIDDASDPEELVKRIMEHTDACLYPEHLRRHGVPEADIPHILGRKYKKDPELKPHGRRAWLLYAEAGVQIDLSVMPMVMTDKEPR